MKTATGCMFTVFTPTYNRAHTLPRVLESLQRQTFQDFEWLVVDDGSTDGTPELFERLQKEARFPIRYLRQAVNSGKHVAFNRGVREAAGELFLSLDSDDACVPNALARFKHHWDAIPADRKDQFSAVTCLCMDEAGRVVGDRYPKDVMDSDSIEAMYRFRVKGEKWGFHRTTVLRDYPFPEPPGVKYVPESLVWLAIARRYRTRFVNECLRIYHVGGPIDGRMGVLSADTVRGRRIFHATILNDFRDARSVSLRGHVRSAINFGRYSFMCGLGPRTQLRDIRAPAAKALVALCAPAAILMFLKDGWRASGRAVRPGDPIATTEGPPACGT